MPIERTVDFVKSQVAPFLNNLIIAVLTLLLGVLIGRILGRILSRSLHAFDVDKTLNKAIGSKISIENIAEVGVAHLTVFLFLIISLNLLGLTSWAIWGIAILVAVFGIVYLCLTLKDLIPNLVSGLILQRRGLPKLGQHLKIGTVVGKVVAHNLIETKLKTKKGDVISLSSRQVLKSPITKLK